MGGLSPCNRTLPWWPWPSGWPRASLFFVSPGGPVLGKLNIVPPLSPASDTTCTSVSFFFACTGVLSSWWSLSCFCCWTSCICMIQRAICASRGSAVLELPPGKSWPTFRSVRSTRRLSAATATCRPRYPVPSRAPELCWKIVFFGLWAPLAPARGVSFFSSLPPLWANSCWCWYSCWTETEAAIELVWMVSSLKRC